MFFWRLPAGGLAEARQVVEQLRSKAAQLRWEPVSEVIHLDEQGCVSDDRLDRSFLLIGAGHFCMSPHEVVFFTATPPGDGPRPFGLAAYPAHVEGDSQVAPTHLGRWCWVGVARSPAAEAATSLMQTAAELGLKVTAS